MFTIQFGKAMKRKNSTKIESVGQSYECLLLDNTSIINPTFKIRFDNPSELFEYNYCYVPEFKRYYFITDIISENSVVFYVVCECDVLATFRDDILATKAFVQYSQVAYNASLLDSRLPKGVTSTVKTASITMPEFTKDGTFALTVASASDGETGASQTVLITKFGLSALSHSLFEPDIFESLVQYFTNPMDALISCVWTPYKGSGGGGTVDIMGVVTASGENAPKTVSGSVTVDVELKYSPIASDGDEVYNDYRNCEPFAEHSIFLPGAGLQLLSLAPFIGSGKSEAFNIEVEYNFSPCTGAITYKLKNSENPSPIMIVNGNLGVEVPIAQANRGYGPAVANTALTLGTTAIALEMGVSEGIGNMMKVHSAMSTAKDMMQAMTTTTTVSGSLGAWANAPEDYNTIKVISRYYDISEVPTMINNTIGRPLFKDRLLSDLSGYTQCVGAHVKTWATKQETDMISMYVNNYGTQPYGGFFIE